MTRRTRLTLAIATSALALSLAGFALFEPERIPGNPLSAARWSAGELEGDVAGRRAAGTYTYVLVEAEGARTWAVVAEPLPEGARHVRLRLYASLDRYTSARLNETFAPLHFATILDTKETTR